MFLFFIIYMMYYINLFYHVKPTLHPWDKFHLAMMYNSLYMLIDLAC